MKSVILAKLQYLSAKNNVFEDSRGPKINKQFIDLSKAVDAKMISETLRGLKSITHLNPENPQQEILNLNQAINIFK